ncbi:hypothetical protein B0H13DRAFT_1659787 [Mycena leptocephala]|nr:hypothetical protein B0H13DRAFT_1659787 [Mycena leptocephala]
MTDYTSQGKSRAKNVVDLTNCRDHRSYYVALSRGTTADGTAIIQGFDEKQITSGMSGYLRQELRELEILDEITKLRFEGRLPASVTGLYRRRLLRSYYAWKSDHRDPSHFHKAMRWNENMGPRVPEVTVYDEWRPTLRANQKRKLPVPQSIHAVENGMPKKKRKLHESSVYTISPLQGRQPCGMLWDSVNHSCGYDATLTIFANLWAENPQKWSTQLSTLGPICRLMVEKFTLAAHQRSFLESARNEVRRAIHTTNPQYFPYGPNPLRSTG